MISTANRFFRPLDSITRAEAVKMILLAKGIAPLNENIGYLDIDTIGDLSGYINAAAEKSIITSPEDNAYFRPNDTSSR